MTDTTTPIADPAPGPAAQNLRNALRPWLVGIAAFSFFFYGIVLIPINLIAQLVIHGRPVELAPGVASSPYDFWTGDYPFPPPWWLFAATGILLLAVAIMGYPGYQDGDRPLGRISGQFSDDGSLARTMIWAGILEAGVTLTYDGFISPFDLYYVGPVACFVGAAICLVRWRRRRLPLTARETREFTPATDAARILGAIKAAVIVLVVVVSPIGIAVNQYVYLATHGGAVPSNNGAAYLTGDEVWARHLPIGQPWQVFLVTSLVYLLVLIATWPKSNRQASTPARPLLFASTASLSFFGTGFLIALVQLGVAEYYGTLNLLHLGLAPAIAVLAALLSIVRQFIAPEASPLSRTPAIPDRHRRPT
jgi:hypothetical protein